MCISQKASLSTFIISSLISGALTIRGNPEDYWAAAFIMSFNAIQLIEYFAWKGIDEKNRELNSNATSFIPLALFLQPLIQSVGSYYTTKSDIMKYIVTLFWLIFGYILSTRNNYDYISEVGENKHLVWYKIDKNTKEKSLLVKYNYGLINIYLIGLVAGLFFAVPKYYGLTLSSYGILSFLFVAYKYPKDEFSTMWCLIAVFYGVLALVMR